MPSSSSESKSQCPSEQQQEPSESPSSDTEFSDLGLEEYLSIPPQGLELQPKASIQSIREAAIALHRFRTNDSSHPFNYQRSRRLIITAVNTAIVIATNLGSSATSGIGTAVKETFHVDRDVMVTLTISIYMLGYVVGPTLWAPLSEYYGRKPILILSVGMFVVLCIGCALARTMTSFLIIRFFQGWAANAPVTITGAVFADIYNNPLYRGRAFTAYAAATGISPLIMPCVSGYLSESKIGWQFSFWIILIVTFIVFVCLLLFQPETYSPVILLKQARTIRSKQKSDIMAPIELEGRSLKVIFTVVLTRPIRMFISEPIVFWVCIYLSFIYGLQFMFFVSYPIIFQQVHHMNPGKSGLMFFPMGAGLLIGGALHVIFDSRIEQKAKDQGRVLTIEERRLSVTKYLAWGIPIALFIQAWTSYPSLPWVAPMLSGIPFGIGFTSLFIGLFNYLTDCYKIFAASALGMSSICRSVFAVVFPLIGNPLYGAIGVKWASTIFGIIGIMLAPLPLLALKYGEGLRAKSKFCQFLRDQEKAGNF